MFVEIGVRPQGPERKIFTVLAKREPIFLIFFRRRFFILGGWKENPGFPGPAKKENLCH
jgi:hypothetical protein